MTAPAYNPISNQMSDEDLVAEILALEIKANEADKILKRAKNEFLERKAQEIKIALMQKPEPFGSVTQEIGEFRVKITTPKRVEWNQDGLADLYAKISADPNEDAREYIKIKYEVSEDAYKAWPTNIKGAFEPHRTVKSGSVSVKIEPSEK